MGALTDIDDQCIKLQEVLKDSVFGVYDVLQKNLTEVVDWHKMQIEQDDTIDGNLRLADYFAQCAEDNATIALMEYLKNNYPSKRVASVDWFSTECSEDGTIVHKPLCGVCAIRFKDRLELLLLMSSRVSVLIAKGGGGGGVHLKGHAGTLIIPPTLSMPWSHSLWMGLEYTNV